MSRLAGNVVALCRAAAWVGATSVACALVLALAAWWWLAPRAGEWALAVPVGPWRPPLAVHRLLRLATAPGMGPLLDGLQVKTTWGPMHTRWQPADRSLVLACAPCAVRLPALGQAPLPLAAFTVRMRRQPGGYAGTVDVGSADGARALAVQWEGQLRPQGLQLRFDAPAAPIADWYAALLATWPERSRARIGGTLAWQAVLDLPERRLALQPTVAGFTVRGLGTEALAGAGSACGPSARLPREAWLSRAVIAAEDQRFDTHPGYDLTELLAAWGQNQQAPGAAAPVRGGSTLSQQLAKLLLVGDERSASRKLRELLYAVEMEQTLGKARILQLYLDNAPWGGGVCGAEAAARHWFGRSAAQLTPQQAVWLAAMLHAPDAEAGRWQRTGQVNIPRAQWVAEGVRGIPGLTARRRRQVVDGVAALAAPGPAAPSTVPAARP